jgi:amidophosphoribosyltransferase
MPDACHSESPKEACGLVGVYAPGTTEVGRISFYALFQLQHRGQESAGITVGDGRGLTTHKRLGLVTQVFDEEIISGFKGHLAVGHTRYSTTGSNIECNTQPIQGQFKGMSFVLAHNGNLVNSMELRHELEDDGAQFGTTVDSELIVRLIESMDAPDLETAVMHSLERIQGAYSLVIGTPTKVMGIRDPWGVRPLCLGELPEHGGYLLASETCAFQPLGADFLREIEPGECVIIDDKGLREIQVEPLARRAMCLFEFIYFARPDTRLYGATLWNVRRRMGNLLADEHPVEADIVIPVPDTAYPAAVGYAEESRIPYTEGLVKNRYIQRTFIQPEQSMRELGVRMKLAPLRENLLGRRVIVVDDSIVRGTTTRQQVKLLRDAGASEVHLRISSPPVKYPCYYGIDMAVQKDLIAHRMRVEQIREHLGADSLGYLSLANTVKAVGLGRDHFCRACFDGKYPCDIPEPYKVTKLALEHPAPIGGE